jgi:hypothetical protein
MAAGSAVCAFGLRSGSATKAESQAEAGQAEPAVGAG